MGKGKQTEEVQRKENAKLTVDEQRCSTVPRKAANVFQPLRWLKQEDGRRCKV